MKIYDNRFNEQQVKNLYFNKNKTVKEISEIVDIPIEPLRLRMNIVMELSKIRYEKCPICNEPVPRHSYKKHVISHRWAIMNDLVCKWCKSQHVVKDGFCKIGGEKKQTLICRKCGRSTVIGANGSRSVKETDARRRIAYILRMKKYTYREIVAFMRRNYDLKIDGKTAWRWVKIETGEVG